jgi:cephalosporin hydroxylase
MKLDLDTSANMLRLFTDTGIERMPLYSKKAFELLTELHQKVGWQLKQPYSYSWMGLPILQIPDDMIRVAEVIHRLNPDFIVETGVAHGGSLAFYASIVSEWDGQVIGIEKGVRCMDAISKCPLAPWIEIIEGDSVDPDIVRHVYQRCLDSSVFVILDSDHSQAHIAKELEAYHDLIKPGYYILVQDGNRGDFADVPRGNPEWAHDNGSDAALEFVKTHPEFTIEQPQWPFNESWLTENISFFKNGWIKRK